MKDSNIIPKNYKEVEFFYLIKVTKEFENLVRQNSTPKNILFPIFNQLSPKFQNSSKNFNEFLRFLYQTHFPANRPRKRHIRITYVAHKSEFVFLLLFLIYLVLGVSGELSFYSYGMWNNIPFGCTTGILNWKRI